MTIVYSVLYQVLYFCAVNKAPLRKKAVPAVTDASNSACRDRDTVEGLTAAHSLSRRHHDAADPTYMAGGEMNLVSFSFKCDSRFNSGSYLVGSYY